MAKELIEAALFISTQPLDLKELSKVTGISSLGALREQLNELSRDYENSGVQIIETAEGWLMQVRSDLLDKVAHLTPHSDLTEGEKRTLALIAYKEPMEQREIIKIQGNKAYNYIKSLTERGLIDGKKKGHTKDLFLTAEFENYFGESKEKIRERLAKSLGTRGQKQETLKDVAGRENKPAEQQARTEAKLPEMVQEIKQEAKTEKKPVKREEDLSFLE